MKLETVKQEKIILGLIDNHRFLRAAMMDRQVLIAMIKALSRIEGALIHTDGIDESIYHDIDYTISRITDELATTDKSMVDALAVEGLQNGSH